MKTKVIIFDFDGTLNKPNKLPNSWARIWDKIGCAQEDDRLYNLYANGELSYIEWCKKVIEVYKKENVSKEMLNDISKDTELIDGVKDLFSLCNKNDIKIIILSGGIKNIIEYCLKDILHLVSHIEANELVYKDDKLKDITFTNSGVEDKSFFINKLMKENNLNKENIVFVGNASNDEDVYKAHIKTICINPYDAHFDNKKIWTHYIKECKNILDIWKFIE